MFDIVKEQYKEHYLEFVNFVARHVEPQANNWDTREEIPGDIIALCGQAGYLGSAVSTEFGGKGWDYIVFGLLNEAFGRGSASLASLFNVHTMVAQSIEKWGTEAQKKRWLPAMAKGEIIGAFGLSEPAAGSDVKGIETSYTPQGDGFLLNGKKQWITFGALADIVLVFGKWDDKPTVSIAERDTPGFKAIPLKSMLGFRSAHLAILEFEDCRIPEENIIGKPGNAFSYVAPFALSFGRLCVACQSLGILRGCLETCGRHVLERSAFSKLLVDHGMIRTLMADMGVDHEAAKLLCWQACKSLAEHRPDAMDRILTAKYFASRAASRHSSQAVQILGARGCQESYSTSRYYRDAKAMEIIEGSNQIQQMLLGKSFSNLAKHMMKYSETRDTRE